MDNQNQSSRVVWQRVSEIKGSEVMCLDCRTIQENKRDLNSSQPTDIVQHLTNKQHNRIQIGNNSNKTSIKVVQCFNCLADNAFKLRIYIISGTILVICDQCASDSSTVLRNKDCTYRQFNLLSHQRVVENNAINNILVNVKTLKQEQKIQNNQSASGCQQPQQQQIAGRNSPNVPLYQVNKKAPQLILPNKAKQKKNPDKNQQLIGSDKVLKNQIPAQRANNKNAATTTPITTKISKQITPNNNIHCLDCKQFFNNEKMPNAQKSSIIKHLMKTQHNRIEIIFDQDRKVNTVPNCFYCNKRDIFNMSICNVENTKYLLCSQCLQKHNCSIFTNNPNIARKQITNYPNEPLVINFFINALYLNHAFHEAQHQKIKKEIIYEKKNQGEEQQVQNLPSNKGGEVQVNIDTSVKCLQCNNIFLNERKQKGAVTGIVRHLKKCNHCSISISKSAMKTNLSQFKCLCCNTSNIFILNLVELSSYYIVLCKSCISQKDITQKDSKEQKIDLESCHKTPIIANGAINSLLMNLTVKQYIKVSSSNTGENKDQIQEEENLIFNADEDDEEDDFEFLDLSLDDQDPDQEEKQKKTHNVPCQFTSSQDYAKFFKQLLALDSKENQKQIQQFTFTADITYEQKISFNYPQEMNQMKVGIELKIKIGDQQESCFVEKVEQDKVVARTESKCGSNRLEKNVTIWKVYQKVIFDRLNNGIRQFQGVEQNLQKTILGQLCQENVNIESADSLEIVGQKDQYHFNHLNKSQKDAIDTSIDCTVSLIQGPPGTGKTETAAHLIIKLVGEMKQKNHNFSNKKILVCAPSNLAADNIADRIYESKQNISLFRVVSQSRQKVQNVYQNEEIVLHYQLEKQKLYPKDKQRRDKAIELLESTEVIITTCINSVDSYVKDFEFEIVVIDEANQAIEPEAIISLQHQAKKLILVGDHKQLPPIVTSTVAAKNGLKRSLFARLIQMGHNPHFLCYQYRMHPGISQISSSVFYSNKLKDAVTEEDRRPNSKFPWINQKLPVQFYNVQGQETTLQDGRSYLNEQEALQVIELVKQLKKAGVQDNEIGIITPYSSQSNLIKKSLNNPDILVDTVYSFQGKEKEYIIISCVRVNSYGNLGVLRSPQLINVSITRAKRGMLFVGNKQHLSLSKWWRKILEILENNRLFNEVNSIQLMKNIERISSEKEIISSQDNRFVFLKKSKNC